MILRAINWNGNDHEIAKIYWEQNIKQFWIPERFKVSRDLSAWSALSPDEQAAYVEVLSGLTGLDREQGDNGMPLIGIQHDDKHEQAVFGWMTMMEHVHAKSYSYIFSTLISQRQSDYYLTDWVNNQPQLQEKYDLISHYYNQLYAKRSEVTLQQRYMAMTASVFLETFSFYSGFFYPIYLAGQGKMVACGEIIHKIIEDESIHGSFTGFVAQRLYHSMSKQDQLEMDRKRKQLLDALMTVEKKYSEAIYSKINLVEPVMDYLNYNANRALQNLGFETEFDHNPVNAIVLNGINTATINHDFFSTTGDYAIPVNIEPVTDEDFNFDKELNETAGDQYHH
jgi:Ribonucleotide reductase, beta subunit